MEPRSTKGTGYWIESSPDVAKRVNQEGIQFEVQTFNYLDEVAGDSAPASTGSLQSRITTHILNQSI